MSSYDFYDYPDFSTYDYSDVVGGAAIVALAVIAFTAIAIGILMYVFESLSLYKIAKNRGIENPWLAWIPIGNAWILGKIGDYYTVREGSQNRNFAVWLVCLVAASFIPFVGYFAAIAGVVLEYICIYKFYKNVSPNNGVLMLVMSIIFSVAMPFILFANRNKPDVVPPAHPQYPQGNPYSQPNYNSQVPPYQYQQPVQPQANPYQQPMQQPVQPQAPAQPVDNNDTNQNQY